MVELYSTAKRALAQLVGASEDLLHVHAGLVIFVIATLLFHRRMRSPVPLLLVAFFAAANELIDLLEPGPQRQFEWLADFANTIFWPAVLFLIARRVKGPDRIIQNDRSNAGNGRDVGRS